MARPPVVVSGLPNMTPIFSLIWLMKIRQVLVLETAPVSLRRACDMNRACNPMWLSPISPSSAALGTSTATKSTTSTSITPRVDQRAGNIERLLAAARLGYQRVIHIHAELAGVVGIESMFRIKEGRGTARALRFRRHLKRDRGLARRFRSEHFDHAAARQSAHSQQPNRSRWPCRDYRTRHYVARPEPDNRSSSELL